MEEEEEEEEGGVFLVDQALFASVRAQFEAAAAREGVLVAAHRGTHGGNIVQNTIGAYQNALLHGADILETDCVSSTDGVYYLFHDGNEKRVLGCAPNIKTMSSHEVDAISLLNDGGHRIAQHVNRLEEVLAHFKGKALLNIDRCWDQWEGAIRLVEKHGMLDQVFFKSPVAEKYLNQLEESKYPVLYMPIVYTQEEVQQVWRRNINLLGLELIFDHEEHPLLDEAFLKECRERGMLLWVNPITLDDKHILTAGHDDNRALLESFDAGWGWLIKKGFTILQTDWPALLKPYARSQCNIKF